jgi:hypothetical protein
MKTHHVPGFFALFVACNAPLPRPTTASDARIDDPWLEGERCAPGTPSDIGMRVEELEHGDGPAVADGQTVRVHYVAQLPNGTVVHDTRQGGSAPLEIILGSTKVVCGLERALMGAHAGAELRVTVPWRYAFGERGKPPEVPPRTDLTLIVDLYLPGVASLQNGSPPAGPGRGGRGR